MCKIADMWMERNLVGDGHGPLSSPSFPVVKKLDKWRGVVDFRALNEGTVNDGHPLPRIEDIVLRRGQKRVYSVIDLKDAFHQIPMHPDCGPYTCTSTPRGTKQWRVLAQGLKNGPPIFQKVVEYVLQPGADAKDPYFDDILVGSEGTSYEAAVRNHDKDLRRTLDLLAEHRIVADPAKCRFFVEEVEFCGHILRGGTRRPAPGKLLAVQRWELPPTVTALRAFFRLANYYSSYVPMYAALAAPLMDMLKGPREEPKKGSKKQLKWSENVRAAFQRLKNALVEASRCRPSTPTAHSSYERMSGTTLLAPSLSNGLTGTSGLRRIRCDLVQELPLSPTSPGS
jgi:hypothetical protein